MGVKKLSISVPADVEQAIKEAAARAGLSVSAWVAEAAKAHADYEAKVAEGIKAARELIEEVEAESGPITKEEREEARQTLISLGVIPDVHKRAAG